MLLAFTNLKELAILFHQHVVGITFEGEMPELYTMLETVDKLNEPVNWL